ncbi:armadillo repeat-containing protein LFR-like [Vitis riparia]|uniref:armadillo repeat-containing protein LFR-like n=1 Tax=Vitis riparia TaxID=96939 RepID=UPI00155AD517|nr:armadillo repeat-containing protein LFR-like [Vitis riparia]
MTVKVKSAVYSSEIGIPVPIICRYAVGSILMALNREHIDTLFHGDAYKWVQVNEVDADQDGIIDFPELLNLILKRDQNKLGGTAGGAITSAAKRGCPFGSGGSNSAAAAIADAATPSTLLGPSLHVHGSFADQNNKRIVMALQSGLKSELRWAINALTLLYFKKKDDVCTDATPLANIPGLLDALFQVIDGWRDIALPKELAKAPRARLLGANSIVTGFGNECEALGSNDVLSHPGFGSFISEASVQKNTTKLRPLEWWLDEDGLFHLDEKGWAEKQQCAVAALNIIRNFSFMPENEANSGIGMRLEDF